MFYVKLTIALQILIAIQAKATIQTTPKLTTYEYLKHSSIIFGLTTLTDVQYDNQVINSVCQMQLQQTEKCILAKQAWALKMLDASGGKMSGFMFGQNFWLGSRDTCHAVQTPMRLLISTRHQRNMDYGILNETAPFDVNFVTAYLQHNSKWQVELNFLPGERIIPLGLCMPAACDIEDLSILMQRYIHSDLFGEQNIYELNLTISYIKKLKLQDTIYENNALIFVAYFSLLTLVMCTMAAYLRRTTTKDEDKNSTKSITNARFAITICDVIKCFDIKANATKLFAINTSSKADIAVINGIRSIIAVINTNYHVVFYSFFGLSNKVILMSSLENGATIFTQTLVDFFLTTSGFLQVYNFLNNAHQMKSIKENGLKQNIKEFSKKIFHRWLRLAPIYYVVVCLDIVLFLVMDGLSVQHLPIRDHLLAAKHWWRYLTFTQNFIDSHEIIASWTWSMACDFQFYTIGTLLLFLYAKKPVFLKYSFVAIFVFSISIFFYNGIHYKYGFKADDFLPTVRVMYVNPFVRCLTYMMGGLLGWYLVEKRTIEANNSCKERLIGNAAFLLFILLISPLTNGDIKSHALMTLILLLARMAHAIWTCWLVLAAKTNRRTWLTPILEWNIFQHISPLSYAMYLINPLLILYYVTQVNAGIQLDITLLIILCFGFQLATYAGAIVISLAFEMPYANLSSLIMKRKSSK